MDKKIYIIHENDEWTIHLEKRLKELNLPYEKWHLDEGLVDLSKEPPQGVFYNRMSASSHTRDHRYAPELASITLDWLEDHNRKVINGSNALRFEVNKVKQYLALEKAGITTPKTIAAVGKENIIQAAKDLNIIPFITKHNRAGKGLGVQLFDSIPLLEMYLNGPLFEDSVDGITLIQEYIDNPNDSINRAEFINGKHLYTVKVKTDGSFQLCPADVCQIETNCPISQPVQVEQNCPVGDNASQDNKFTIIEEENTDLIKKMEAFLKENKIDVSGIEYIKDASGKIYAYDVNTNTNYNPDAEALEGKYAMLELAKYLGKELESI